MATKKISALVSEGKILTTPDGDEYLYIYEPDGADDANKGLALKLDVLATLLHKSGYKSISMFFAVPVLGDGAYYFDIPEEMNGWELTDVHAHAITAPTGGLVQVQIRNVTDSVDVLSTVLSIDAGEHDSNTAATPPVINPLYDDVATDDIWAIDFDAVNSAEDLVVRLTFTGDLS
jgi:hypothetical protein